MSDRALPYACTVANRAVDALATHGELALAGEVAIVNRATCDLVHALHREREALTTSEQSTARFHRIAAEGTLRGTPRNAPEPDDVLEACITHLQALLQARRRHPDGPRRHIGFCTDEPV